MTNYKSHQSVLLEECLTYLSANIIGLKDCYIADLTFGAGGHTKEFLERYQNIKMIGVDQDPDAIENAKALSLQRLDLHWANFKKFPQIYKENYNQDKGKLMGVLIDLGVSSHQFDQMSRGFSFRESAFLDMRMNYKDDSNKTAADVLNSYTLEELVEIFERYGEEKFSQRIAQGIVDERAKIKITDTKQLENIAFHAYPKNLRHKKIHPATKVFQALRIEVNQELKVIEEVIDGLIEVMPLGCRLAIISFHSLEDRIVKHKFKDLARLSKKVKILTKKPIVPSAEEISNNKRSRSAKLRVIERVSEVEYGNNKENYQKKNKKEARE